MNCSKTYHYQERRIEEALFSMLTLGKKQLQLYTVHSKRSLEELMKDGEENKHGEEDGGGGGGVAEVPLAVALL